MPQAIAAAAVWVGSTVGTAVGASLTAVGVTAATALPLATAAANAAWFISEIAIYVGLQGLINDIAHEKAAPQGYELALRNAADVPREMIIGQRPVAGSVVARYSRGSNLYNAHFVYQLADHPCVELSKVYGDGRLVRSTPLTHGVRTEITAYSYSGGPRLWMTWHDGRPGQTADTDLITKSAQDPDVVAGVYGGWTTNHRGAGCAYVHVEVQFDSDILTSIPEFLFDVKGAKLYDRRKDTTAGGSGSHRHDDPSTWEWTANAAVALDHYMLGYKVEGDTLAFGVGLSPIELPYATFAQLADLADEDVVTGTGADEVTLKRAEAHGIISAGTGFEDVITSLANQMCARVVDLGGQIGVLGAEERTSVVSLDDDDWASDESVRYAPHLAFSDLYGAVVGSFPDPENLWQPTPYPQQDTEYLQLPDGGEAPIGQLDLPFETNRRRAVRIASAWLKRESLQPRLAGTFATRSNAWKLAPGDWFTFSSTRLGITNEKFEVVDNVRHEDFTVTLTARAINPDFLAFSVDDDPDLGAPPALDPYNLLLDPPEFDVEVTTLVAGGIIEPAIEFTLTSDETVAREVVIEYAKWDTVGLDILGPSFVDSIHTSQIVTKIRKGILPSTPYVFRAKSKAGVRESEWTAWSAPLTTGGTYTVGEASSVPWSGVTDSGGRPDDNADVTSANTSAAIAGQGAFATLSSAAYGSGLLTGFGGLAALAFATLGTNIRRADGTTVPTEAQVITSLGQAATIASQGAFATVNTAAYGSGLLTGFGGLAALAFTTIGTNTRRADGTTVATEGMLVTSLGVAATISGQGAFATVNTAAYGSGLLTGFGTVAALSSIAGLTAGSITGQGAFATISSAAYGSGLLTGFGSLAALAFTTIGTNTRRADGTTVATEGMLVTSLGVAATISGQGAFATVNTAAYGSGLLTGFGTVAALSSITGLTAGSITGQGAFATVNTAAYGSGLLTGFGSLAALAFTTIGTNTRRADGTTVATEGMLVTSLGVAATISGQGAFATVSTAAYGSGLLTGFGTVAALSSITGLTAGSITGQGAFATISTAAYGSGLLTGFGTVAALSSITGLTAGAITGQQWGATATEDQARAMRGMGLAKNPRFEDPFSGSAVPPNWGDWSNGSTATFITKPIGDGKCVQLNGGATQDTGWVQNIPVAASQDYLLSAEIRRQSGTLAGAGVHCQFYNASNVALGSFNITMASEATTAGITSSTPDGVQRWEKVVSAPAGSTYVLVYAMSHWSGHGSIADANSIAWYEVDLIPMSLVRQLRADVTGSNTAGAIAGQGALATLAFVQLASNVRLADGTTVATDIMVVTASGVAAGIAGQGALATVSIVNTVNIAANAGTYGAQTETDADINTTTSWQDIASITGLVVGTSEEVDLFFSAAVRAIASYASGVTGSVVEWRLLRGGTEIYSPTTLASIPPTEALLSIVTGDIAGIYDAQLDTQFYAHPAGMDFDVPGAGTYSYYLQAKHTGDKAWTISKRRLKAVLRKR